MLVFWDNGPEATRNPYLGGPFSVTINGTFANGTSFSLATAAPGGATVTNDENGIVAAWEGSGFSFTGTNLHKPNAEYHAKIDNPELGIRGSIVLRAVSNFGESSPCQFANLRHTACATALSLFWCWIKANCAGHAAHILGQCSSQRRRFR